MKHYQISKYSDLGFNDWSAISDIGGIYKGEMLSRESYLFVEDLYIEFINEFVKQEKCSFKVHFLMDLRDDDGSDERLFSLDSPFVKIRNDQYLDAKTIATISRLCLRELMGIRLENDSGSYITFGDDFYLCIGANDLDVINLTKIHVKGLFINEMENDPHD